MKTLKISNPIKKAVEKLIAAGFDAIAENSYVLVRNIRNDVNEQLFLTRSGIATDLMRGDEECGCRNFSDLDEYIATA